MIARYGCVLGALLLLSMALISFAVATTQTETFVLVLEAEGPLTSAMAEYLERGLEVATRDSAEALVFQLDTPGGEIELTNRMEQSIRASEVPVIVYIAPRGAIAGSAGTIITLAGHAAAMAPETAIGAASPVGIGGEDLGETIETKVREILKATVRGLAERRGAEVVELAELMLEEARAVSATEALEVGMIDAIADDIPELLAQVDGLEVLVNGDAVVLTTASAQPTAFEMTFIEQLLQALTNPNIVLLLLAIGVQAILIELSSPGGWVAGFVGAVCLALGAYGLGVLPVNWIGVVFLVLTFILFVLEVNTPTFGALTAAGALSFIVGALVLFNSPSTPSFQRVSIPLVFLVTTVLALIFALIMASVLRARRKPATTGAEGLLGWRGSVDTVLSTGGTVRVAGERWQAELEAESPPLAAGELIEVIEVDGLQLKVRPAPNE